MGAPWDRRGRLRPVPGLLFLVVTPSADDPPWSRWRNIGQAASTAWWNPPWTENEVSDTLATICEPIGRQLVA
jgi:hypothetical protein